MRIIPFILLSILFLAGSCEKSEQPEPENGEQFFFGWYYGFCVGESCIEIFKIEDGKLFEDTLDKYPDMYGEMPYEGEFTMRDQEDHGEVKGLPSALPEALFNEEETVLGMPDAADGGGLYVARRGAEGEMQWRYIDRSRRNVPNYLHDFMKELELAVEALQD